MHKAGILMCSLLLNGSAAESAELLLERDSGEVVSLEVDDRAPFSVVIEEARTLLENERGVALAGWLTRVSFENPAAKAALDTRDYYRQTNKTELDAIRYIVLTLGNEPLFKLYKYEGEMKKAGERFSTVHPLNIWKEIFTSNDTTSALFNARGRKLVWKPFMKGMAESLQEAYDGNNMKEEYIADFAAKVGIDPSQVKKPIYAQDWSGFVQTLLDNAKKPGKDDRYDM
ncbi:hypothetical protein [Estrella lausannensis]|uniref:Conserved putative secreted protein n=1 Tax=Estrella lausannensis TaxID=483423 RepID=A0A0H5DQ16_9BACT|nr:hypothetical protein [Estrella lausannensis]CRX37609.1 Conserved putative secreted protein [Estrella lausannensis]